MLSLEHVRRLVLIISQLVTFERYRPDRASWTGRRCAWWMLCVVGEGVKRWRKTKGLRRARFVTAWRSVVFAEEQCAGRASGAYSGVRPSYVDVLCWLAICEA